MSTPQTVTCPVCGWPVDPDGRTGLCPNCEYVFEIPADGGKDEEE